MFNKKTIRDIDLTNRIVMVRTDYNVPIQNGQITDDYRIRQSLPTLTYLRERGCRIVVVSHLGRPNGQVNPEFSLEPVASRLGELLGIQVQFLSEAIGDRVKVAVKNLAPSQVVMLENLRFYPGEEPNDREFARQLSEPIEYFVQDGFGVVHRSNASTVAITEFLPSMAGLLLEKEYRNISGAIENPIRPLVAIIGGSKIKDKIDLINRFLTQANTIIVAGAMANTFLVASGHKVGKSQFDADEVGEAKDIMKLAQRAHAELVLPLEDVAVASEISNQAERREIVVETVSDEDFILDFGMKSLQTVLNYVEHAGTVIWNGPLGVIELTRFAQASEQLARFIGDKQINCVVGGGDTAGFIHRLGLTDEFTHVSTGGGASLELLSGKTLPGIESLLEK
jgi:phosphoglycerate kinase